MGVDVYDFKGLEEDPRALADNEQEDDGEQDDVAPFSFSLHFLYLRVHCLSN